jgi:hypothetical protein
MSQTTEISSYEKQTLDFLQETGTSFQAEYLKHDKHFITDKETRDIYRIKLKNATSQYYFNFGQCLLNSKGYKPVGPFAQKGEVKTPTAYDVLACLQKYDPGTFENFCSDFGYDTEDSEEQFENLIKPESRAWREAGKMFYAKRTYRAVLKEWEAVQRLFTPEQIEKLQEIQ